MHKTELRLKRYTTTTVLLDLLYRKKLVFSNPKYWEDKNDTILLEDYREKKGAKKIFVLCFSSEDETIHCWKTFANGISGCCINFHAKYLLSIFDNYANVIHRKLTYKKIAELKKSNMILEDLPFTKRNPYRIEEEYRAIWLENDNKNRVEIDIDLSKCIESVVLSQNAPYYIKGLIDKLWYDATGMRKSLSHKSTVFKNNKWINHFLALK